MIKFDINYSNRTQCGLIAEFLISQASIKCSNKYALKILIIGFCILLRVILTVNNNTFCFATIDKVFIK
jgi:hypothetical protein